MTLRTHGAQTNFAKNKPFIRPGKKGRLQGMKAHLVSAFIVPLLVSACVAPPVSTRTVRYQHGGSSGSSRDMAASSSYYSMGGTSAANPPIKPGETSSAYRAGLERQQREAVPDAQVMYQNNYQDAFGRRTDSGIYRSRGGVMEEVHIGNQPVLINPGAPMQAYPNVYQGGYAPPGTGAVYDPYTGRALPVRR